jgi:predicted dinucleotide-binding enzyme
MKIGVLGSGEVARTLAAGCIRHGHQAMLGTREPARLADWLGEHPQAAAGSYAEAARFGELVILAVKGTAAAHSLRLAGAENFAGKPVADATNPIADEAPVNGMLKFFTTHDDSLMERLQREFPAARLVKAFSAVGHDLMIDPVFDGGRPTMFICGDDGAAKQVVAGLAAQFGWDCTDIGRVEGARAIEPLRMLWSAPGLRNGHCNHAFKLLRN